MKNEIYEEFVKKFKPKKTTDDCYTPPSVYAVIRDWACAEYGIDPSKIVRPFWPGGDYEHFDYPEGCVVLDNPPFSILTKICTFYLDRDIPFFLFAPSLTALSGRSIYHRVNHIITDCAITYENGAVVKTSFISSYGGDVIAQSEPRLTKLVNDEVKRLRETRTLPKYIYPHHIVTASMLQKYSKYGIDWKIHQKDCVHISKLDSQGKRRKAIYGGALLVSNEVAMKHRAVERAAIERAEKERTDATIWELSDREREIIAGLG